MSTPGANFQCFGDIFPYLTDELVESEGASVENMIDSLYNYGLIHGDTIQGKLEKSPFYTKEYKKITPKQQQLLRAERVKRVEVAEESDYSEDEPVKIKQPTKKGKAKAPPKETALAAPTLLNSGRTFVGVSFISPGRSRGDEKSGRGNKAVDLPGTTNQNTFEATITVSNRRISVGSHPTVELAAQAHDRALIRANGPMSYKQAGLLNYPLSFYASDSLSKFSIFDTLLRKQLFGSDWTGPKPVDFGFLMTQHSKVPTKRGADFNAMDGSGRKKRHKGQYREGDDSGSDCDFGIMGSPYMDSGSYKKKKLLYGNYYVTTEAAGREDAETAEPYFKSPVPAKRQPSFTNKKIPKAAPVVDASLPMPGDTVVLMHGIKERNQGRPAYERSVILKKMPNGGWLLFGLADRTTRPLRGEVVTLMGPCESNLKFMKVPPEAVTDEDRALSEYFEQQGLMEKCRPPRTALTQVASSAFSSAAVVNDTIHSVSSVNSDIHASVSVQAAPVKRFAAKDLQLASSWYQGSSQHANKSSKEEQDAYEPESLYNLADYPCLGTATMKDQEAGSDAGTSTSLELSGDPTKRGSRSTGTATSALGSRPPNFQIFASNMFAHKLNDLMASACYLLPQELLLYRVLLGLAEKHVLENKTPKEGSEIAVETTADPITAPIATTTAGASAPSAYPLDHPVFPSASPPTLPVLPWHRSLLHPASPEMRTALSLTRQQLHEVLVASLSAGVDLLALIERAPQSFHGVQVVTHLPKPVASTNSADPVESKSITRYTFELSTESRKLVLDLGISAGIVNASTIIANGALGSSLGASQPPVESGRIIVGYFSSALEAALVREQVLGLTRSSFGIASSYGAFAGERSCVPENPNFTPAEWTELKKIAKFLTRFTRKFCLG
eukprot:gene11747-13638_t